MKDIKLLLIAIGCIGLAVLVWTYRADAATYPLCVAIDYTDQADLAQKRDWTAAGMNYKDTVIVEGEEVANPVSELQHIKAGMLDNIYQWMKVGWKKTDHKTETDALEVIWVQEHNGSIVDVP